MTCYLHNGTASPGAVPCDNNAVLQGKHTGCCNPGDLCLSNGLCRNPTVNNLTNYAWFFGCTDKTFTDSACGNHCEKFTSENHQLVFACPQTDTWCCNRGEPVPERQRVNRTNTACCSITEQVFKAPWPTILAPAAYSGTGTPLPIVFMTGSTASRTLAPSATDAPAAASASATSVTSQKATHSTSLAAGLGAGLGGAAVIALGLGWFVMLRKKSRRATGGITNDTTSENGLMMTVAPDIVEKDGTERFHEHSGKEAYEMHVAESSLKLKGDAYRAELADDRPAELSAESPAELPANSIDRDQDGKFSFEG